MKYLIPKEKDLKLKDNQNAEIDLTPINNHIGELSTLIENNKEDVDKYIADSAVSFSSNTLNGDYVKAKEIKADSADIDNLKSHSIDTDTINSYSGTISTLYVDTVYNNKASSNEADIDNLTTSTIVTDTIKGNHADFDNLSVENLSITGTYDFNEITADKIDSQEIISGSTTTHSLNAEEIEGNTAVLSKAEVESLISPHATLQHICNEEIWHSFYSEQYDVVRPGDTIIYEFPKFKQGYYVFTLRDPDTFEEIFSVYITNTESNLTYAYSQGSQFIGKGRNPLVYGKVKDVHSDPQLYLMSNYGGIGYWHYEGLEHLEEVSPATYTTWPFIVTDSGVMSYEMFHRAATVFTHHLDYGDNTSTGVGGGDFVVKFVDSVEEATKDGIIEYNPDTGDALLKIYVPDQDVDTDANVQFHRVATDELAITSITKSFMFLRSRADGTFEVVLALNPETITGIQPIDNPVTGNAVYYWNGIALGGSVTVTDVITIETSKNLNTNIGQGIYQLQQLTLKEGVIDITSKALKRKTDNDYIFFNKVEHLVFNTRPYTKYTVEGTGYEYNGLSISFMDDNGELYDSNFDDYDLSEWSIPSTGLDYNWYDAYHYATAERVPINDSEGTNEYHLIHLGDGTRVHGSLDIDTDLTALTASIPLITTSTLNTVEFTTEKLTVHTLAGSTLIKDGDITTTGVITGSTLSVSNDINTKRINASERITTSTLTANVGNIDDIYASTIHAGNMTLSSLSTDKLNVTTSAVIGSTLQVPNGFFNSVDSALVKANRLRAEVLESLTEKNDTYTRFDKIYDDSKGDYVYELKSKHLAEGLVGVDASSLFENRTYDDKNLVYYSAADKDWKSIGLPTKKKQALVGKYADNNLELSTLVYEWGSAGGGSGTVLRLTNEELTNRLKITDPDNELFVPDGSLVVITDDDQDYLQGEDIAVSTIGD